MKRLSTFEWLSIIAFVLGAAGATYATFQTQRDANAAEVAQAAQNETIHKRIDTVEQGTAKRLDSMDGKLDKIVDYMLNQKALKH